MAGDMVIVGVDGSAVSRHALRFAAEEARLSHSGLTVVMVEGPGAGSAEPVRAGTEGMSGLVSLMIAPLAAGAAQVGPALQVTTSARLRRLLAEELGSSPGREVHPESWRGDPAAVLAERSASAAVLVVGARGRGGLPGLRVGSVAQRLLHRGHCPVTLVVRRWPRAPQPRPTGGDPVVVGLAPSMALSGGEDDLVAFAATEAARRGSPSRFSACSEPRAPLGEVGRW